MKRKLKSPTISLDLCVYLGVETSCLCMRWPVWERLKSGNICAQSLSHQIFQARVLEQVTISFSRESSLPRDQTYFSCVSSIGRWILYHQAIWKAPYIRLLLGHFWGSWKTRMVRETGLKAQKGKLIGSSCSLRHTGSQHLPSRGQVSPWHSQHPVPSHFGPPVYLTKGPPCLWHLESESCSPIIALSVSRAAYPRPCLADHSSSALQAPGCWRLPGLGPLPHLDIWN